MSRREPSLRTKRPVVPKWLFLLATLAFALSMVGVAGFVLIYFKNRVMDPCKDEVIQVVPSPDSVVRAQLTEVECTNVKPNILRLELGFGTDAKTQRALLATKSLDVKITWISENVLEFDGPSSYVIPMQGSIRINGVAYKVRIKRCSNLSEIRRRGETESQSKVGLP